MFIIGMVAVLAWAVFVRGTRWLTKQIAQKHGVSRQVDLVRLVLSLAEWAEPR